MKKIKLKQFEDAANLSPQEMKDVKGGSVDYFCSCVLLDQLENEILFNDSHQTSSAMTPESCDSRCSATCFDHYTSCSNYSVFFSAGGNEL